MEDQHEINDLFNQIELDLHHSVNATDDKEDLVSNLKANIQKINEILDGNSNDI